MQVLCSTAIYIAFAKMLAVPLASTSAAGSASHSTTHYNRARTHASLVNARNPVAGAHASVVVYGVAAVVLVSAAPGIAAAHAPNQHAMQLAHALLAQSCAA